MAFTALGKITLHILYCDSLTIQGRTQLSEGQVLLTKMGPHVSKRSKRRLTVLVK